MTTHDDEIERPRSLREQIADAIPVALTATAAVGIGSARRLMIAEAVEPVVRAAVAAGRAPLLARIAELEAERDRYRSSLPVEVQDYWYWRTRAEQAEAATDGPR